MIEKEIGRMFRELNIPFADVARQMDINYPKMYAILTGRSRMSAELLMRLFMRYGLSFDELATWIMAKENDNL